MDTLPFAQQPVQPTNEPAFGVPAFMGGVPADTGAENVLDSIIIDGVHRDQSLVDEEGIIVGDTPGERTRKGKGAERYEAKGKRVGENAVRENDVIGGVKRRRKAGDGVSPNNQPGASKRNRGAIEQSESGSNGLSSRRKRPEYSAELSEITAPNLSTTEATPSSRPKSVYSAITFPAAVFSMEDLVRTQQRAKELAASIEADRSIRREAFLAAQKRAIRRANEAERKLLEVTQGCAKKIEVFESCLGKGPRYGEGGACHSEPETCVLPGGTPSRRRRKLSFQSRSNRGGIQAQHDRSLDRGSDCAFFRSMTVPTTLSSPHSEYQCHL